MYIKEELNDDTCDVKNEPVVNLFIINGINQAPIEKKDQIIVSDDSMEEITIKEEPQDNLVS